MSNSSWDSGNQEQAAASRSGAPDLAADADALTHEVKSVVDTAVGEAKASAADIAHMAKAEVGAATDKAKSMATEQKDVLAEQVTGVAGALDKAASELEANNEAGAHYARMIAQRADKLSGIVRDNSVDDLLAMAQDFGRRQPAAFVGAAALLGFAASRFVTASAKRREDDSDQSQSVSGPQPASSQGGA